MIKPILDAVNTPGVAPAGKKLWFGMQVRAERTGHCWRWRASLVAVALGTALNRGMDE